VSDPYAQPAAPVESPEAVRERLREEERVARENIVKRNLIVRLDRLRMRKCNVTTYTMEDSAVDMQNELDRHYSNAALEQDMKSAMIVVKSVGLGVHCVNSQFLKIKVGTHDFPKMWEKTMDDCMPAFEVINFMGEFAAGAKTPRWRQAGPSGGFTKV
jgi:hypothetical protein